MALHISITSMENVTQNPTTNNKFPLSLSPKPESHILFKSWKIQRQPQDSNNKAGLRIPWSEHLEPIVPALLWLYEEEEQDLDSIYWIEWVVIESVRVDIRRKDRTLCSVKG